MTFSILLPLAAPLMLWEINLWYGIMLPSLPVSTICGITVIKFLLHIVLSFCHYYLMYPIKGKARSIHHIDLLICCPVLLYHLDCPLLTSEPLQTASKSLNFPHPLLTFQCASLCGDGGGICSTCIFGSV